jgi:hypothetical protein
LHTGKLYTYECAKTQFLSDEEEKRRYSHWIEHPRGTNYIGYQTYLRIKELLHLDGAMHRPAYCSNPTCEQLAKALVAEPYPI